MASLQRILKPRLGRSILRLASTFNTDGVYTCDEPLPYVPKTPTHVDLIKKLSESDCFVKNEMSGVKKSFTELADESLKLASKLKSRGIGHGDHVMVYSYNHEAYVPVILGVMSCGAIPCLANPSYTEYELEALCKHCDIQYIIPANSNIEIAKSVSKSLNIPILFVTQDLNTYIQGFDPISDLSSGSIHDVAVIGFSSGTTGLPKGVQLSHDNLNSCRSAIGSLILNVENDSNSQVCLMPFYHAFGFSQFSVCLERSESVLCHTHFDPKIFLRSISESRVPILAVAPPLVQFLAKHPIVDQYDITCIEDMLSGAAPLSADLITETINRHNNIRHIRQGWGMTETTSGVTFQRIGNMEKGSCGEVVPYSKLKVVDVETGEVITDGRQGEILAGGKFVMKGYYKNDKANAETLTSDNYVRSGDIGYVNENGSLFITDRLKELIKVQAYQVAPAELEGALSSHPLIADAAVIGVPHAATGETPKAFVVKAPGAALTDVDVKNFIADKLSKEKHLGHVEFIDQIPKLPSGKILRKDLRKRESERQSS